MHGAIAPTQGHVELSLHRQQASPCQRGTGSCCSLGDIQRTASRAHACRSQPCAPWSAP